MYIKKNSATLFINTFLILVIINILFFPIKFLNLQAFPFPMLYETLIEKSVDRGYNPIVLQYKNRSVVVHRENSAQAVTLGVYDSRTNSLKPLKDDMRKPVEDLLFSAGFAKHDSVYHNQDITNLL